MKDFIKNIVLFFIAAAGFVACKNYKANTPGITDSLINNTASMTDSSHLEGARLIAANDCITCHSVDKKMFGPSFSEIAAKYNNDENLAEYLSGNVVKGSRGLYGNNAMTPHPNLKHDDLIQMLRYVLSVNTAK